MKTIVNKFFISFITLLIFCSFIRTENNVFPYQQFGLTKRQAAAHLLNRFTYGATQTDVDAVEKMGLEKWFEQQLKGNFSDQELNQKLSNYDAINLTNTEVENTYPRNAQLINLAVKSGYLKKDSVKTDSKAYQQQIQSLMRDKGYKPQQELFRQFINQKILRAIYTQNQLRELMTDFWFNHFNVSLSKNQCAVYVPAFERDVIRPNVFGNFEDLLLATAKSPAMLMYLDNFSSSGSNVGNPTEMLGASEKPFLRMKMAMQNKKAKNNKGLNENYAREVMELHTLGVDGGYTQNDVTQAARVLTGWTIAPMGDNGYGASIKKLIDKVGENNLTKNGFVREGDFMFVPNQHDNGEKTVLGKKIAADGYNEGIALLKMLAHHSSTAKFIAKKIATRFVSDNPPQSLIDKMSESFLKSNGNIKTVLLTMVNAPEFWSSDALREKTKSPFEFAISTVKILDASVNQPYQLYNWITKMGQQMYYYQAPTGFPDNGQYWINTGSLLNRMNFGLALAAQRIPGISFDLIALNNHHEPESAEAALSTYSKIFMPERNLTSTLERLKPMLTNPNLEAKVAEAATQRTPLLAMNTINEQGVMEEGRAKNKKIPIPVVKNTMLSQVVGVIIGSPEFQRK